MWKVFIRIKKSKTLNIEKNTSTDYDFNDIIPKFSPEEYLYKFIHISVYINTKRDRLRSSTAKLFRQDSINSLKVDEVVFSGDPVAIEYQTTSGIN